MAALSVGSQRNVVHIAQTQQGVDIRLMRLGGQRTTQENHKIHLLYRTDNPAPYEPSEKYSLMCEISE